MDPLYIFQLSRSVNEMTHVGVTEEIRDGDRIKVTGVYGKDLVAGFRPATHMVPFRDDIRGERLEDLQRESLAAGRPADKDWYDMDQADVADWLEEDPAIIETRIEDNRPDPEEEA